MEYRKELDDDSVIVCRLWQKEGKRRIYVDHYRWRNRKGEPSGMIHKGHFDLVDTSVHSAAPKEGDLRAFCREHLDADTMMRALGLKKES